MLVFEKRLSILANFALEIFPLTFSNAVYTEGGGARRRRRKITIPRAFLVAQS